jgi:hypothetical protein
VGLLTALEWGPELEGQWLPLQRYLAATTPGGVTFGRGAIMVREGVYTEPQDCRHERLVTLGG